MCDVYEILRRECDAKGLSGNEISRRTGLSQTGVAKILRGESDIQLTSLLAVVVGSMPYAVFADYLEERRDGLMPKEDKEDDWDYIIDELRKWPQ